MPIGLDCSANAMSPLLIALQSDSLGLLFARQQPNADRDLSRIQRPVAMRLTHEFNRDGYADTVTSYVHRAVSREQS